MQCPECGRARCSGCGRPMPAMSVLLGCMGFALGLVLMLVGALAWGDNAVLLSGAGITVAFATIAIVGVLKGR